MTENESLRAALRQQAAWVRHWQEDIASGLAPTRASLMDAADQINEALSFNEQSQKIELVNGFIFPGQHALILEAAE